MIKEGNWNTENFYVLELFYAKRKDKIEEFNYSLSKMVGKIQRIDNKFYINCNLFTVAGTTLDEIKCMHDVIIGYGYQATKLFLQEPTKTEIKRTLKEMKKALSLYIEEEIKQQTKLLKETIEGVKTVEITKCSNRDFTIENDYKLLKSINF